MKINKGKFFISPSDLNNFVACKFTIKNEIKFHNKEISKIAERVNDKLWKEMGIEHEKKHFKLFKDKYKKLSAIHHLTLEIIVMRFMIPRLLETLDQDMLHK